MAIKYKVKVSINQDACISCGTCSALMPEAFETDPTTGKHKPTDKFKETVVDEESLKKLKETASMCPTQSIKIEVVEKLK